MNQHGSRVLLQFANFALCDAVLKVSVDSTERESLTIAKDMLLELVVRKDAIVCMIMKDFRSMRRREAFKGLLGLNCLFCACGFLQMHVAQSTVMVNEDGCYPVAKFRGHAPELCDESWCGRLKLIDRNAFTRFGDGAGLPDLVVWRLAPPWPPCGLPKQATSAQRHLAPGELSWQYALVGEKSNLARRDVAQPVMPMKEVGSRVLRHAVLLIFNDRQSRSIL